MGQALKASGSGDSEAWQLCLGLLPPLILCLPPDSVSLGSQKGPRCCPGSGIYWGGWIWELPGGSFKVGVQQMWLCWGCLQVAKPSV